MIHNNSEGEEWHYGYAYNDSRVVLLKRKTEVLNWLSQFSFYIILK